MNGNLIALTLVIVLMVFAGAAAGVAYWVGM
jgi:hypothetical protein